MHPAEMTLPQRKTREPDTVSTVGGKDAYMGYLHQDHIAPRRL